MRSGETQDSSILRELPALNELSGSFMDLHTQTMPGTCYTQPSDDYNWPLNGKRGT